MSYKLFVFYMFTLFWCPFIASVSGQNNNYREFHNIHLDSDASLVNCFVQDESGLVWLGTGNGLYSYDGYRIRQHIDVCDAVSEIPVDDKINCGIVLDTLTLMLGADNGVLIYNTLYDYFEESPEGFPVDIRALVHDGATIWVGSLSGLYKYNVEEKKITKVHSNKSSGIPHDAVYTILKSHNQTLYVGTYNGLCFKTSEDSLFHPIPLYTCKSNILVNSLLEDTLRDCIWIGTEGHLFQYDLQLQHLEKYENFDGNSIKSLALDIDNNLLLGTDNGLYVFDVERSDLSHVVHDSRDATSLTNNIIWGIMRDKQGNMWFGTNYGASLYNPNKLFRYVSISEITGTGDGNQFYVIKKDVQGHFWFGGTNGLICYTPTNERSTWYTMGDGQHHISHNRIRCIYEGDDDNLWVATDGSISLYNKQLKEFTHYNVIDSSGMRNANWAYGIIEDDNGYLWIISYLGGIFVVDKAKLLASDGDYVADYNLYEGFENKKSGGYAIDIEKDKKGNIWVLHHDNEVEKIDAISKERVMLRLDFDKEAFPHPKAYEMLCDAEGFIWVGYSGGLACVDPTDNQIKYIHRSELKKSSIRLLTEVGHQIWITTSDGTLVVDKLTMNITHSPIVNDDFSCSYYDTVKREIYLGGVDGFIVFSPEVIQLKPNVSDIKFTALYVNDTPLKGVLKDECLSVRHIDGVSLNHSQNTFALEFSDLSYSTNEHKKYVYKIPTIDSDWRVIEDGTNRLSYANLAPGQYHLQMGELNKEGKIEEFSEIFNIQIQQPWYYTLFIKIIYLLILAGIFFWVISYFRNKHLLKIERINREKSLELSQLKSDFFTNVSHELKTPLSMIIAPVSKLLLDTRDAVFKEQLSHIQKNALRLNTLIQQIIGIERFDANVQGYDIILSKVEFVEFARGVFSTFEDIFNEKLIVASFHSNVEKVLVNADVVKMESILNNVISNACKYTPNGGVIDFNINVLFPDNIEIIVKDSGIGIKQEEFPHLFKRFYQTKRAAQVQESSGIGLYLVKTYVELHGGAIDISSPNMQGTTVTLNMPIVEKTKFNPQNYIPQDEQCTNEQFKVLIVEDNLEISGFIKNTLSSDYICDEAHNGKIGLEKVEEFKPDLILADVMMPIMDGMEFVNHLKKSKLKADIPVIMLTAKDDRITEETSIKLGIDAFISKPFDINMLALRIEQLLHKKENIEEKLRLEIIAKPKGIEAKSLDESLLFTITQLIEDKINSDELNVAYLSEKSGVSSKQIYRKIKQLTGMTPVEYIRTIRLKKAALLLNQEKFSIAEVMYLVGFSNPSYFSKCFQKQYGKSPKQYVLENK